MLAAIPFLVIVVVAMPVLAWVGYRAQRVPGTASVALPSARSMALQTIALQAVVGGTAWLAASGAGIAVSWRSILSAETVAVASLAVASALGFAWLESRRPLGPDEALRRRLRQVGALDPLWLATAIVAAVAEEFAYRGVLPALLGRDLGMPAGIAVSALVFGLAHLAQGWRGAAFSAAFGLAMQAVVLLSQGLFLAIAAHLAYDLCAAALGRRRGRVHSCS
jgi:membrane protease YdiL (CAAX protease family)